MTETPARRRTRRPKGEPLPLAKPGDILRKYFLEPLGLSARELAVGCGLPVRQVNDLLHARKPVTVDMALRLQRCLGVSAEFWLNFQHDCDLRQCAQADPKLYQKLPVLNPLARGSAALPANLDLP